MSKDLRNGGILAVIALATLLIGTATGNAYVMLGLSVVALVTLAALFQQKFRGGAFLAVLVAAATAATATGIIFAMR